MLSKRAGGGDGSTRGKKCKDNTLSMLENVELQKKLEKGMSVETLYEYYGIESSIVYGNENLIWKHYSLYSMYYTIISYLCYRFSIGLPQYSRHILLFGLKAFLAFVWHETINTLIRSINDCFTSCFKFVLPLITAI